MEISRENNGEDKHLERTSREIVSHVLYLKLEDLKPENIKITKDDFYSEKSYGYFIP